MAAHKMVTVSKTERTYRGRSIVKGYDVLGVRAWLLEEECGTLAHRTLDEVKRTVDMQVIDRAEHRLLPEDDRCCCGAEEAWLDVEGEYGCMATCDPWADPLRAAFGQRKAAVVRGYAESEYMTVAEARNALTGYATEARANAITFQQFVSELSYYGQ